jgi:glycosyltransferase involved in cell wall biosynthesis
MAPLRVKTEYPEKDISVLVQDGQGKGDAVRKGFDQAKNDVLMILDADLTVQPEDLPKFFEAIVSGKGEFINGSRLVYQMEKEAMRLLNLLGNKFFSRAFTYILEQRIKDTLCGTKVLWKEDYKKIIDGRNYFGDFDPFGDFDLLFGASKLNLKIVEIPVRYGERSYGKTQISRFSHGMLLLKMTLFALKRIKFI